MAADLRAGMRREAEKSGKRQRAQHRDSRECKAKIQHRKRALVRSPQQEGGLQRDASESHAQTHPDLPCDVGSVLAAVRWAAETSTKGSVNRPVNPSERNPPVRISSSVISQAGVEAEINPHAAMQIVERSVSTASVARKPKRRNIRVVRGFIAILPIA